MSPRVTICMHPSATIRELAADDQEAGVLCLALVTTRWTTVARHKHRR